MTTAIFSKVQVDMGLIWVSSTAESAHEFY